MKLPWDAVFCPLKPRMLNEISMSLHSWSSNEKVLSPHQGLWVEGECRSWLTDTELPEGARRASGVAEGTVTLSHTVLLRALSQARATWAVFPSWNWKYVQIQHQGPCV